MEYTVINSDTMSTLIVEVNAKIKEGWEPQGGIFRDEAYEYFQAMIKK